MTTTDVRIENIDELEALPVGTVLLDRKEISLHLTEHRGWIASNGAREIPPGMVIRDGAPLRVLHTPSPAIDGVQIEAGRLTAADLGKRIRPDSPNGPELEIAEIRHVMHESGGHFTSVGYVDEQDRGPGAPQRSNDLLTPSTVVTIRGREQR